ncbi:DUF2304 domain-containing protein [Schaalia vaccimaxillae]|uniref:DUF2304 domain-containing protein n=1 Tax=Schaalia vaccimaxillae TaxID=183916 RepID=UPI0003B43425|nr:DUF2304 domain-containing protein [Schaalia vaccimaxillae]
MTQYWLIKLVLLCALLVIAWWLMRPIRSSSHLALRRLATVCLVAFAIFAVLFPGVLNRLAAQMGVERGLNLLVYALVLAFFAQIATAYRRDEANERRITNLARAIALANVHPPSPAHSRDTADPLDHDNTPDPPKVQ